jgi:hypothetical protein
MVKQIRDRVHPLYRRLSFADYVKSPQTWRVGYLQGLA